MIYKILVTGQTSFSRKVKNLFNYVVFFLRTTKVFNERYRRNKDAGFKRRILNSEQKKEYQEYWSFFHRRPELKTIETCYSISGVYDKRIVPENLFATDLEKSLQIRPEVSFLSNKSFYNKWFGEGLFPKDYVHKIEGAFYDRNLEQIPDDEVMAFITEFEYPLVVKPNVDTSGGANVFFPAGAEQLKEILKSHRDLVVQEKINSSTFFDDINSGSLSTVRVVLYKSVSTNQWGILNMSLRMGKDGSLDNESAGGIVCDISPAGLLNTYATDKYGTKYKSHPNSGFAFSGRIPYFEELQYVSMSVAKKLPYVRLIGLDVCLDCNNRWRVIEVNMKRASIRFAQYAGKPFFGSFTNEVVEYCKKNHWALK